MGDQEQRRGISWRNAAIVMLLLLALPGLYCLSVGPVSCLWFHGYIGDETYFAIYRPLTYRGETSAAIVRWYIDLWLSAFP